MPFGQGETALHLAAGNDDGPAVELLLKHGADAGAKNNDGAGRGGERM